MVMQAASHTYGWRKHQEIMLDEPVAQEIQWKHKLAAILRRMPGVINAINQSRSNRQGEGPAAI
ncbi:hypothetical protein PPACK8108_LOCUS4318 [Phakopsora pachyrhizi]|uniref:Uncharacterized protein n=1 Tax=Phakopsora pachyrhizi TaxID=170000 RepID=A0AAV0ALQ0_PHAPC|nr:hypothetical protein PPACK8108_LOCUS4318 [Phakopsora pachyrhizi]